jgi:DNA-binding MarR family transcriptional regulator
LDTKLIRARKAQPPLAWRLGEYMVRRKNGPIGRNKPADGGTNGNGRGEPVDYGPLADWVGFNLRMAQAAAFQAFSRLAQEIGTRPGRFATLMLIGRNPGISQTALSRANGRDKSSLTPVLNDLARRGLVIRRRTRADQRTYRLSLTPAGRRLLAELTRCAREHERKLDQIIGAKEQKDFVRALKRIIAQAG